MKVILSFVILFVLICNNYNYSQDILWEKQVDIDTNYISFAYLEYKDGFITVCGDYNNTGEMLRTKPFVARFDSQGNYLWKSEFNSKYPIFSGTVNSQENKIVFLGYVCLYCVSTYSTWFSPYKAVLDNNGNLLFSNFIDSSDAESIYLPVFTISEIFLTKDNDLLLTSHVDKGLDTVDLLKFNSNVEFIGNYRIDTSRPRQNHNNPRKIVELDNSYFIVGYESDSTSYVLKLNSEFKKEKKKKIYFDSLNVQRAKDIRLFDVDKIICLFAIYRPDTTLKSKNLLVILDKDLNIIKKINYGSNSRDWTNKIEVDERNGDIICYGSIRKNDEQYFKIHKFDKNLNLIWEKEWQFAEEKERNNVLSGDIDEFGNIYVTGFTGWKPYLAKIHDNTASVENDYLDDNFVFTPNPATDYIEIKNVIPATAGFDRTAKLISRVKVYDVLGVCVLTHPLAPSREGESVRIDVSGLAAGVYFVSVGGRMYKFVKM